VKVVRRLAMVVGLVAAWGAPAQATVVLIGSEATPEHKETIAAARQTAPELSFADVDSPDAAEQLRHADVVLAVGPRALTMARTVAPETPIVYAMVPASEAQPGKLVTGVALEVPAYAQFAQWKQLRYDGDRIGVIYDPKTSAASLADAQKAAASLGLTLVARPAGNAAQVRAALVELAPKIDLLWLAPDASLFSDDVARATLAFAREHKVAAFGFSDALTQAGALVSMAPDARDMGRRAARIALGIAGRAPAQRVPVPPPASSPGALSLNASTAAALGIDLPEGVIRKARKVFH
jgi:putative ABC transport system substrate-binding protein